MSKQHRKVTVDNSKSVRDSSRVSKRRQSVFDRLGPGGGRERISSDMRPDTCRNWLRDRNCPFGSQCNFQHSLSSSRDKRQRGDRSPESRHDDLHIGDLRYKQEKSRHHGDRKEKESSQSRGREMMVRRNRSPESDTSPLDWRNPVDLPEADEWEEGNENLLDFERELTLEMRRQQLQRELELEIEKEKREKEKESVIIEKQIVSDDSPVRRRRFPVSPSPPPPSRKSRDKRKGFHISPDSARVSKGPSTPPHEPLPAKKGAMTPGCMLDSPPYKSRHKSPLYRKGPHTPSPPHPEDCHPSLAPVKRIKQKKKKLQGSKVKETSKKNKTKNIPAFEDQEMRKKKHRSPKVKRKVHSPSPPLRSPRHRSVSPPLRSPRHRSVSPIVLKRKLPFMKKHSPRFERTQPSYPSGDKFERQHKKIYRKEIDLSKERESRRDKWERKQDETIKLRLERQREREKELFSRKLREQRLREERAREERGRRSHRESPASLSTSSIEGDRREPKMASKVIPTRTERHSISPTIKRRRMDMGRYQSEQRDTRYQSEQRDTRYQSEQRDTRYQSEHMRDTRYGARKLPDMEHSFKRKPMERTPVYNRGYIGGMRGRGRGTYQPEREIKPTMYFQGHKRKHSDIDDLSGSESPFRKRRHAEERSAPVRGEARRIPRVERKESSPHPKRREENIQKEERDKETPTKEPVEERLPVEEVFSDWSSEDSLIEASVVKSSSIERDAVKEPSKPNIPVDSRHSSRANSRERDNLKEKDKEFDTKKIVGSFIEQERLMRGRSASIDSRSSRHSSVGSEYRKWESRSHKDSDRSDKREDVTSDRDAEKETMKEKAAPEEAETVREGEIQSKVQDILPSIESNVELHPSDGASAADINDINADTVSLRKEVEIAIEDTYEAISDDELEAMIEDDSEKEQPHESEIETVGVLDVDFASLMNDCKPLEQAGTVLNRFCPGIVLATIGVSKPLAGPLLMAQIKDVCQKALADDRLGSKLKLFESELGAFNAASIKRQRQRARLFTDIGPCRHALCARRDMAIRKQLRKSEKDADQSSYTAPDIDVDLYRQSIKLFKGKKPSVKA